MQNVIIIGGGPAGLTAAYELSKLGLHSRILEADDQVGGISRTVNYKGFHFDIGGHRFFTKVRYVRELWHEMLGEDFLLRQRLSRIHYRGCFFDYPLKAMNALSNLGMIESLRVMLSYGKVKVWRNQKESNFEEWVTNRFGSRLYNIFFKTYTEKVWGIPCNEISEDWAAQRIKNLSLKEALRQSIFGNGGANGSKVITSLIEQFHYPRLGPGMMWECCANLLVDFGNEINYNMKVERIRHKLNKVQCIYGRTGQNELIEIDGDQFISTMPLRELILSMDPLPPDEIIQAAKRLRYRDYLTVVLIVNRENVFPDNWIYIHTPEVKMGRIQNYKNWSPDMVPDLSKTSLGLEYFLWEDDEEWQWPEDRLIDLGIRECSSIGLINPEEVEGGTLVRMKKTYPVYDQMYHESVAVIHDYLKNFVNIQTIGRNGLHRYNNQDHSMLTGVYAARNVRGADYDLWSVNTEMKYSEEIVADRQKHEDHLEPVGMIHEWSDVQRSQDQVIDTIFAPLDPLALGISIGLVIGFGVFLGTTILLIKGGPIVGPTLSLLGQYLIGFKVTWSGAFIGLLEGGGIGFLMGQMIARIRNWSMITYAKIVKRRSDAKSQRDLLDKV